MDFKQHSSTTLVQMYNDWARELGENPIKKFQDRATAERRVGEMFEHVRKVRAAQAKADTKDKSPTPGVKGTPPKKMSEAEDREQARRNSAAIRGEPTPAQAKADPAGAYAALGGTLKTPTPRWRKPKHAPASKTAYKPRPGSLQQTMYSLLTQEDDKNQTVGVTVEEFCSVMAAEGAKPTMTKHEQTWSNLGYLFVSLRGYGLDFDGSRIRLLVPKDERDAAPPKPKKEG